MKRSILARSALAAVAAAGIVAAAGCSSDTNDAVSQATESAAAIVSSAAEAAQSAASNASEAAQSAATSASEAAQSVASNASEAAQSAASNASEAAGSAVTDASAAIGDTIDATLPDGTRARISTAASQLYERIGGASSSLGAVEGSSEQVGDGTVTPFEGGNIYTSSAGSFVVQGEILRVYEENGGPQGALGYPTADEATIANGWESAFQNGTITWTGTDGNFTANVTTN